MLFLEDALLPWAFLVRLPGAASAEMFVALLFLEDALLPWVCLVRLSGAPSAVLFFTIALLEFGPRLFFPRPNGKCSLREVPLPS